VTLEHPPALLDRLDTADPAHYRRLLRDAHRSGSTPVLMAPDATRCAGELPMPADPAADLEAADPFQALGGWWPGPCPDGCHCLEPFEESFPTTPARVGGVDWSRHRSTIASACEFAADLALYSDLAVVDARRPADVPLALGWAGMCNYWSRDLVGLCAVLRSWEERFGALLVHMSFSTLLLAVARPPRTPAESELVAVEHFAFCPDQHDPQDALGTVYTPRTYAAKIQNVGHWRFWWD
jgi:hypothetical protein